jgi:hypothetical protein
VWTIVVTDALQPGEARPSRQESGTFKKVSLRRDAPGLPWHLSDGGVSGRERALWFFMRGSLGRTQSCLVRPRMPAH